MILFSFVATHSDAQGLCTQESLSVLGDTQNGVPGIKPIRRMHGIALPTLLSYSEENNS